MAELSPILPSRTSVTLPASASTMTTTTTTVAPLSPSIQSHSPTHSHLQSVKLEICVDSLTSAVNAEHGGAHRLELCSGLTDGGLTPSYGLIQAVISAVSIPVNVLIRPRPGDFYYSDDEIAIMRADIMACKLSGAAGVVVGCLDSDGSIHRQHLAVLCDAAKGMSVTFHRAIDMTPESLLESNVELLVQHNVDRILTSGLANSVDDGRDTIQRIVTIANNRCLIMAGGGITESNITAILVHTRCHEIHGSARSLTDGKMSYRRPNVYMGGEKVNSGLEVEYCLKVADAARVRTMTRACEKGERERQSPTVAMLLPTDAATVSSSSASSSATSPSASNDKERLQQQQQQQQQPRSL